MDALLTPEETARRLRLSRRTIIAWLQAGRLRGLKVGNRWRVRLEDLEALLDESAEWLGADLVDDLPPYDWGPAGEPTGLPVVYEPGRGLMIEDA